MLGSMIAGVLGVTLVAVTVCATLAAMDETRPWRQNQ